jgi:starch phosphorylase
VELDGPIPALIRPLPSGLEALSDLALDLRWAWSHASDQLWKSIDPEIWEQTRNPWLILQSCSQERLEELARSEEFNEFQRLVKARQEYLTQPGWCRQCYTESDLATVAYFSMEFGLSEALPLYAGGLGILAGDYLKAASDLDVPMVGIGLLYEEGYFRQILSDTGWQLEAYPDNDPLSLPIRPVLDHRGGRLRVPVELPGRTLSLRAWQVKVGRVALYLLDSNYPLNSPFDRGITSKLYNQSQEIRLLQEMVLGIGGWRMLNAVGIPAEICHLNEGHAAFAVLERARSFMQKNNVPFPVALWATRAGNVFTTHTPVAAAFDSFPTSLVSKYFRNYVSSLGISIDQFLELGRHRPDGPDDHFNMAVLAIHGSIEVNGVSQLHGEVSRRIFQFLFPRWPEKEVPVGGITNAVHVPTWDSPWADDLWTRAAGQERWRGVPETLEAAAQAIGALSDHELWEFRAKEREHLITYVRQRLERQLDQRGLDPQVVQEARNVLDPNTLTLGFARRFTGYKRPNLLLRDPDRLARILTHAKRPVQLIAAGKAHPDDEEGKRLVQQFVNFTTRADVRHQVVFLEDYDINLAQELIQGIDVWINTPRRPWEASGTSGMKVLVNGGLNFSELDGWWAEAYDPQVGWALGDGQEHDKPDWDAIEATQLYEILEQQIIPEFYDRDIRGIPVHWVSRIRQSMAQLTPRFSTNRMIQEYVEKVYLSATGSFRARAQNGAELAKELHTWQSALQQYWAEVHIGNVQVEKKDDQWFFEAPVYLGRLDPALVRIELYADAVDKEGPFRQPMIQGNKLIGAVNGYVYSGGVPATRPAEHFSLRIVPAHPAARVPLEEPHILWQR